MKTFSLIIIILIHATVVAQNRNIKTAPVKKHLDIFNQHIKLLDSILIHKAGYDNTNTTDSSVRYMERVTHIKAHSDGNYFGWQPYTTLDLAIWKGWYKNIGSKRIGINF